MRPVDARAPMNPNDPNDPNDPIPAAVFELVARFAPALGTRALAPGDELVADLGYDSLRLVEVLLAIGERRAVTLPIERILERDTLSIADVIVAVRMATP